MKPRAPKPFFPTLDVVATIFAADEFQKALAKKIAPTIDIADRKPSESMGLPADHAMTIFDKEYVVNDRITIPSITSYTKFTLGIDLQWLDENAEKVTVLDRHREEAKAAMEMIQNKVMMMVLKGDKVNGFISNLSTSMEREEVQGRDIGLLTYVPKTSRQYAETQLIDDKKTQYMNSKAIGHVGDKAYVNVTIFNSRLMSRYESILYEGHDDAGNLITFFKGEHAKAQFEIDKSYRICGKIKEIGDTPYSYGAIVNTLNYVRFSSG
jgi:hypothetical protein